MTARPSCITCDRPLRKVTTYLPFNERRPVTMPLRTSEGGRLVITGHKEVMATVNTPLPEAEARRRTNQQITKLVRDSEGLVTALHVWDGQAWGLDGEGHFCSGSCARAFGQAVARDIAAGRIKLVPLI